ncbi:transglycosylase SLT domain-containing protein [Streptomyces sp. RKAG337]|uniref:transglycosylase SLT domain-containing protein n=1 Tax=Streptomyces sp. RKAG337 TaxID=2893404 RepID=UPI002034609C|nr:transglycosylase SLT domain-containing protein [Streptomyces sp. RKAG337]MCM2429211.1 transglycosylase SLT domain-containing protein [Streptomyces sp. RKAG337]
MQLPTLPKLGRLNKVHSFAVAGTATAALTVLAITAGVQGSDGTALAAGEPSNIAVVSTAGPQSITDQAGAASQHAAAEAAAKKKAADTAAAAAKKKAADDAAKKKAADEAAKRKKAEQAANRSHERKALAAKPKAETKAPAAVSYSNDLDGWIKESLSVMAAHNIPGSYDGIYRNIIRESSGNPQAINLTDSNAMAGIPSKGLLQVIDPTFQQYHVAGTSMDIYDPVANITAACNYAAANYGSIDNVDSAY